jgi:hypothetical protein
MTSISKNKIQTSSSANQNNSKINYQMLEQERNMLKITLQYVAKENEDLKQQLEDMKMTVRHNKELLREYVEKITNKDKVVEKMDATIDQLKTRMHTLEEYIKQSQNKIKNSERSENKTINTGNRNGSKSVSSLAAPIVLSSQENIITPPTISKETTNNSNITGNTTNNTRKNGRETSELHPRSKTPKGHESGAPVSTSKKLADDRVKEVNLIYI